MKPQRVEMRDVRRTQTAEQQQRYELKDRGDGDQNRKPAAVRHHCQQQQADVALTPGREIFSEQNERRSRRQQKGGNPAVNPNWFQEIAPA